MSSESVKPPSIEERRGEETAPTSAAAEAPLIRFSFLRWATSGVLRLIYRRWTRIAVRLFPENSRSEYIARLLHIPLPDNLNMSWVTEHLSVGGRVRPEDIKALSQAGVSHVIDTRSEYCDDKAALADEKIDLLYLPTPDTYPLSVEQLMEGAAWANEKISQGGRVLIHCEHGVGRSVLLTCATLVYGGMHASDALELVKRKRWQAAPNQRQVARLREFEASFRARSLPNA
ncbi:protein-tyrosine phosphatase family protein [Dictyobacter arantiisoli]|uniref:Uncharacterized protein n=1 Tax=Dictyobacter arantiisoli TaxID=2014874 RepID=A0A5A5TGT6_9CHLR|nr:dual specificity protein phosphatase [Dictyobacter arantiisoli]GCF10273.1 hypothetical protein KDI_38370 [Dictyobacter arantiisoli]